MPSADFDAIVIGAGHNGLVCAAYLARAGRRTLLVEARSEVGGTAASEQWSGATVNICNCDHISFRTTPVMDELRLADHGLDYLEVEPAQINMTWGDDRAWLLQHDVEATLDSIARIDRSEADNYRRYLRAAIPAVRLVFEAAAEPPTARGLTRQVVRSRGRGVDTLLRWSRRSAADVMRSYFSTELLRAPGLLVGPMVWGVSPETGGTGLGALTYAMRHVGKVGRPVGGSGRVPHALQRSFVANGGTLRTRTKVVAITCESDRVRGVQLDDGTEVTAPVVVSACNPHDTFLHWLTNPPASARHLVRRWRSIPHADGYESKIDAVLDTAPRLPAAVAAGAPDPTAATIAVAPSLAEMHLGAESMTRGEVLARPGMLANVPSVLDHSLAPDGRHVLSLEVLYTPYAHPGGWPGSPEPRRWMDVFGTLVDGDLMATVRDWRAVTPDRYERDFHLPKGHATSFAGGPLAAVRNRNPELTRYETAVRGLFLTGAATFPGAGVWGASGRNAATVVLRRS